MNVKCFCGREIDFDAMLVANECVDARLKRYP